MREKLDFNPDYGTRVTSSIIKVIGVGGGGGNAVKNMYKDGIIGVDFLICNTDQNALENNPVPSKLVLGDSGLGAGANPEIARKYAMDSKEKIIDFIGNETKMLFITAGMGKGTGTGASPVVAQIAKEMGILTVGVVTLPFDFEGEKTDGFAKAGIKEMKKQVDSLIIIKNENLMKFYENECVDDAFAIADNVLKNAVKCIAELITVNLDQNIDFNDIKSIMQNSGSAMLGISEASGENRIEEVYDGAFSCPLLTEDHITNAKNFLFSISYGAEAKLKFSELKLLTDRFKAIKSKNAHVIWGRTADQSLGDKIKLSVIITNYDTADIEREDIFPPFDNDPFREKKDEINPNTPILDEYTQTFNSPIQEEEKTTNNLPNKNTVENNSTFSPGQFPYTGSIETSEPAKHFDNYSLPNISSFNNSGLDINTLEKNTTQKHNYTEIAEQESNISDKESITHNLHLLQPSYRETFNNDKEFAEMITKPALTTMRGITIEEIQNKELKTNASMVEIDDANEFLFGKIPD